MKTKRFDTAFIFILPGLFGFILFYIWPFLSSLRYAFIDRPVGGSFVGLDNFIGLFHNKTYLTGLKNTFIFIGICVPLNIVLSLTVAMLIEKISRHKEFFTLLFLIPLVIPSGSMVFFWKMFFGYNGFLNKFIVGAGFERISWLETNLVLYVIIFIFIWKNLGYNMILFLAGLSAIPKEYYEAAKVDGANAIREFFGITLFNLIPTFFLVAIMSVINSFKVFKEIYLITGSYPHKSIYMLQHFMNNMFSSLDYQKLTAATCVLVLVTGVLTQFLFRMEKKVSG